MVCISILRMCFHYLICMKLFEINYKYILINGVSFLATSWINCLRVYLLIKAFWSFGLVYFGVKPVAIFYRFGWCWCSGVGAGELHPCVWVSTSTYVHIYILLRVSPVAARLVVSTNFQPAEATDVVSVCLSRSVTGNYMLTVT